MGKIYVAWATPSALQSIRRAWIAFAPTLRPFQEHKDRRQRRSLLPKHRCPRTPLLITLALCAQGCLLGPDFKTPPAPVADKWLEQGNKGVESTTSEHQDWWAVFNDPRLTRLIQLAYQQNLTLQTAGVRVLEARARLGIAIGEFYPQQQQLGASLTYNRIPTSQPFNVITNTYWADQFGVQVAWELDIWGKLRRAIESADGGFVASIANYDDVPVTLVGDVATAYMQIRTIETQIAIAQDNVERQRAALKIAQAKFQYG